MRRLQGQAEVESEIASPNGLLVELRGRIEEKLDLSLNRSLRKVLRI